MNSKASSKLHVEPSKEVVETIRSKKSPKPGRKRSFVKKGVSWLKLFVINFFYEKVLIGSFSKIFFYILFGPIYFQALSAAVRFDLFTLLAEKKGLTQRQVAQALQIQSKPARILLSVLVTIGLLKKRTPRVGAEPIFKNHWTMNIYLNRHSRYNLISIVELYHHIVYRPMFHFYDALKENKNVGLEEIEGSEGNLYQRLTHHPGLEDIFQKAMEQISVQANVWLAEFVDFSNVNQLVDVGGGNGANIIAVAEKAPHLAARVFDSKTVCGHAQDNITCHQMQDRLSTIAGNCFTDPFPTNADCYLFSHFLCIWSEAENRSLIEKTFAALPPGGQIVVFDIMQKDDDTGPLTAAAGSPYFLTLATGSGMIYSAKEYETWIKQAGFSQIKRVMLPQDHVAVIGTKAGR